MAEGEVTTVGAEPSAKPDEILAKLDSLAGLASSDLPPVNETETEATAEADTGAKAAPDGGGGGESAGGGGGGGEPDLMSDADIANLVNSVDTDGMVRTRDQRLNEGP